MVGVAIGVDIVEWVLVFFQESVAWETVLDEGFGVCETSGLYEAG